MNKRIFLKHKTRDQSGQGALEYILVLVVTVGLIIGMLAQFNKSVEVWLNNYFGDYLACLLETGEVPSLGSTSDFGVCAAFHPTFQGQVFSGASSDNNNGGGSGGGNNSDSSSNKSSSKNGSRNSSVSASRGGVNSSSSSTSSGKFGKISKFKTAPGGGGSGSSSSKKGDKTNTGNTNVSTPGGLGESSTGPNVVRMKTNDLGASFSVKRDLEDEREEKVSVSISKDELKKSKRQERFPAAKALPKNLKDTDPSLDVGYGDYLRYLLIFAIIIAILVFFGGQVLQMSKSMD